MKPVKFKDQNTVYAEGQEEYLNLPVYKTTDGIVISCWKPTFAERMRLLFGGSVWHMAWTFNRPLQPQMLAVKCPIAREPTKWRSVLNKVSANLIAFNRWWAGIPSE